MGKFYATSIVLFVIGLGLFHLGTSQGQSRAQGTVTFAGSAMILCAAAAFILAFGYHVRVALKVRDPDLPL